MDPGGNPAMAPSILSIGLPSPSRQRILHEMMVIWQFIVHIMLYMNTKSVQADKFFIEMCPIFSKFITGFRILGDCISDSVPGIALEPRWETSIHKYMEGPKSEKQLTVETTDWRGTRWESIFYAVVRTKIRLLFDGRSTACQRSLRSQWRNMLYRNHSDLFIY